MYTSLELIEKVKLFIYNWLIPNSLIYSSVPLLDCLNQRINEVFLRLPVLSKWMTSVSSWVPTLPGWDLKKGINDKIFFSFVLCLPLVRDEKFLKPVLHGLSYVCIK